MNYGNLAKEILALVGGEKNVSTVTHCATRLRFVLKDTSKADEKKLNETPGVFGVAKGGGQFQVVIGNDVNHVYKELISLGNLGTEASSGKAEKKGAVATVLDFISGSFTPILPAITAAGMLKAVLALLTAFNVLDVENSTYMVLDVISDAAFYFLPIMLAYTSAQKLKANPFIAMMIAGVLLHPSMAALLAAEGGTVFLGFTLRDVAYGSSVIPILLSVVVMSFVEKFADMVSPKAVKFFLKPLIILVIVAPIALHILGPLGSIVGDYMADLVTLLSDRVNWLAVAVLGAFSPLLVMFGMHYAFFPIMITSLTGLGYEALMIPGMLCANIAQGGAALAVSFKTKNKSIKETSRSTGITAVMGITEPAMYGVNLKYKKPFIAVMIGGGVGGLVAGITGVKGYALASPGLAALPIFIGSTFVFAVVSVIVSFVVAFAASYILYKDTEEEVFVADKSADNTGETISSPLKGTVKSLKEVDDAAFSEEILGKGIAIIPEEGKLYAPAAGMVSAMFGTKHAVGLSSESGAELLIHIGIDTVKLDGKYFETHVKQGDYVKKGDLLVEFDVASIKAEGYDVITPIIVTNSDEYKAVVSIDKSKVDAGEPLLTLEI